MSAEMEPFNIIEKLERPAEDKDTPHHLFDDVVALTSAKTADHDLQYIVALRDANPGMIVTATPATNVSLKTFAAAGYATCDVDLESDSYASWRGYAPGATRGGEGMLAEAVSFAKYRYTWSGENFIFYYINEYNQYVLKECRDGEHVLGPSRITDALIKAIGDWMTSILDIVWVYDRYWRQSRSLYKEVMKSSWDNVILDEAMKKELTSVANKFFNSKSVYADLGVPWKRGLMFYGPPGNGKTISIRALMHELYTRKNKDGKSEPIPTLYVKSASETWDIGAVFAQARRQAPCMLVLEDVETIVNPNTRSYFFNEMDGIENNDGLFVVGSTNFLDRLDPGLTKRPSRFDRKYLFPLPNEHERTLYCEFWRKKLRARKKKIEFPRKLCPAMAKVTPGFSFAFLQECFVATLLVLAREEDEDDDEKGMKAYDDGNDDDDLEDYRLWVVFKQQADILRKEVDGQRNKDHESKLAQWYRQRDALPSASNTSATEAAAPTGAASHTQQHCSCCHCRTQQAGHGELTTVARRGPTARSEILPELPWIYTKQEYINSAAFERR